MDDSYTKSYHQLVADVADVLRPMDVGKLEWFYNKSLSNRRSLMQADTPWTSISVLRALEEARVFSREHPQGLADAMLEIKREDQKEAVEDFVEKYRGTLSSLGSNKGKTKTVPRGPRDEKDGPYPPRHRVKAKGLLAVVPDTALCKEVEFEDGDYTTLIPPSRMTKQGANVAPSGSPSSALSTSPTKTEASCSDEEADEDSYSYAYDWNRQHCLITDTGPVVSPESSLSSTSSDGKTGSGSSDGDDYQSVRESWLTNTSGHVTQKMQLIIPPLKRMIRTRENNTISSTPIKWILSSSQLVLKLHIDPMGHHSGVGATLYLQRKPKPDGSFGIVTAELTVHHTSPSVLKSKAPSPSQIKLFQCSLVMDMPDESSSYPLAVATFPMILSHKNLMKGSFINCTTLDLSLTLRHLHSQ